MSPHTHHEVHMYAFAEDADGNHVPADSGDVPLEPLGYTVYVRGYVKQGDDIWEELHDKDFSTLADAMQQAEAWCKQYNADLDIY